MATITEDRHKLAVSAKEQRIRAALDAQEKSKLTAEEIAAELRAGLAGVTPFDDDNLMRFEHGGGSLVIIPVPDDGGIKIIADFYHEADREHFTRCSPDNLAILLAEFDRRGDELAKVAAERDEAIADVRAHKRSTDPSGSDTHRPPKHGYTCFYCGETFRTYDGALRHFGAPRASRPECVTAIARAEAFLAAARERDALLREAVEGLEKLELMCLDEEEEDNMEEDAFPIVSALLAKLKEHVDA